MKLKKYLLWFCRLLKNFRKTQQILDFEETLSVSYLLPEICIVKKISCPRFCHFYHTCIVLLGLIHLSWENGIMTCGSQHRSLIKDDSLFGHGHLSCMGKRVWTRENQVVKCNFTFKKVNLFQMFKTFELRKPAGIETNKHCNFFREHFTNCHFSSIFR